MLHGGEPRNCRTNRILQPLLFKDGQTVKLQKLMILAHFQLIFIVKLYFRVLKTSCDDKKECVGTGGDTVCIVILSDL